MFKILLLKYYNINNYLFVKNIFLIVLLFLFAYIFYIYNYIPDIKVCVCTIGKNENVYVREFIEYYKNYGIDKIFLYDNNNIDGEMFDVVLNDYIETGYVKIINFRGKKKIQYSAFNHCYRENNNLYNWLIFYDLDEFIHLTGYNNIKNFLGKNIFKKCNVVYLNQVMHTDNDQIYYNNKSLFERFPNFTTNFDRHIGLTKIILRGNLSNIKFGNPHIISNKYQCNSVGKLNNLSYKDFKNHI